MRKTNTTRTPATSARRSCGESQRSGTPAAGPAEVRAMNSSQNSSLNASQNSSLNASMNSSQNASMNSGTIAAHGTRSCLPAGRGRFGVWARQAMRQVVAAVTSMALAVAPMQGVVRAEDILPEGGQVRSGDIDIRQDGGTMTIDQRSNRGVINWNKYNVGEPNTVIYNQPDAKSSTLNRVTGGTKSTIAGTVRANGQVYFVNPNGIEITRSGVVRADGCANGPRVFIRGPMPEQANLSPMWWSRLSGLRNWA
ncbi:MAG: filamentous hemagglutinin N-terminal domain-containing protein [Rhizobiales bacterium]|nr:filamentous hemagglutinin N-terminal domain-containing protein [Hyphomicrobiales bacterium]